MYWVGVRLVIFDADGTLRIRHDKQYKAPLRPGDWKLMPGIREALDDLFYRPIVFGIASNQACVSRGEVTATMAQMMLYDLAAKLNFRTAPESVRMCPHLPGECDCRKPQPKMLNDIMKFWDIPPEKTVFIGNAEIDRQAAENAGCKFLQIDDFLGKE